MTIQLLGSFTLGQPSFVQIFIYCYVLPDDFYVIPIISCNIFQGLFYQSPQRLHDKIIPNHESRNYPSFLNHFVLNSLDQCQSTDAKDLLQEIKKIAD